MAYSDDLIAQGRSLATAEPRRPKQASIRRAVSAAYYALFHEIAGRAASAMLTEADAAGLIGSRIRRTVQHATALKAAKWLGGPLPSMPAAVQAMRAGPGAAQPAVDPALSRVCRLFAELQAERHRADYDLGSPFVRAEALRRIMDAESAIAELRAMPARGNVLIFFLGCVLGEGLVRNA